MKLHVTRSKHRTQRSPDNPSHGTPGERGKAGNQWQGEREI